MDRRSRARGIAALFLVSVSLGGCSRWDYHGVNFVNQTGVAVSVRQILANGTQSGVVTRLDPGQSFSVLGFPGLTSSGDRCRVMTLIAVDDQLVEVARREGRICMDDEWLIGARPTQPSPVVPILLGVMAVAAALALALVRRAWLKAGATPPREDHPS
jgi:hypothetical protein